MYSKAPFIRESCFTKKINLRWGTLSEKYHYHGRDNLKSVAPFFNKSNCVIYALFQSEMEPQTSGPSVRENAIFKTMWRVSVQVSTHPIKLCLDYNSDFIAAVHVQRSALDGCGEMENRYYWTLALCSEILRFIISCSTPAVNMIWAHSPESEGRFKGPLSWPRFKFSTNISR